MFLLFLLAICSFVFSFFLTPVCRDVAVALGAVDYPDKFRKLHSEPVPRLGGIPIFIAFGASYCILLMGGLEQLKMVNQSLPLVLSVLPAVGVIFVFGLVDDLGGLRPSHKLAGQLIAAGLACWSGVLIRSMNGQPILGWWVYPITMLWLIGCTNAFNLIDGVDGLASGVGLFAAVTVFLAALLHGDYGLQLVTIPLIGALLGFLRYNFNPASIFLGDCGSLTIGFLLGCFAVVWSHKATTILGMTAPLIALSIPLLDTSLAIVRRLLRGQQIFAPDRRHIHHQLLDRGLTPRHVALLLYGICGIAAALALIQSVARNGVAGLVIVLFCVSAWIGVQHLGYIEFDLARRLARPRTFRRILHAQCQLRIFQGAIQRATSVEDCWIVLRDAAHEFGFAQVSMQLDHVVFEDRRDGPISDSWALSIPLSSGASVKLACRFDSAVEPVLVAPLADLLRHALNPKLSTFQRPPRRTELGTAGLVVGSEKFLSKAAAP